MKKISLDVWVQLLGMLGVLGGLVFVGLEMQQAQRIAIAGQVQARNDSLMSYLMAPLEGNSLALEFYDLTSISGGSENMKFSNEQEKLVFDQLTRVRAVSLQNAWQQHNLGMIPDDTFEFTYDRIMNMYNNCYLRNIIQGRASQEFLHFLKANSSTGCTD